MKIFKSFFSRTSVQGVCFHKVPQFFFSQTAAASSINQAAEPAGAPATWTRFQENLEGYNPKRLETLFNSYSFEENIAPSLNFMKAMKLSRSEITDILKKNPECFITKPEEKGKNNLYRQFEFLQGKLNYDLQLYKNVLLMEPRLASIGVQDLKNRMAFLGSSLKLDEISVSKLLEIYPGLFRIDNFIYTLTDLVRFLVNYTLLEPERIGRLLTKHPYFFNIPIDHLKGNIKLLLYRKFTPKQIASIIEKNPQFLTMKPGAFERCFDIAKNFNLDKLEVSKIFTENPRLFLVCPNSVMPYKVKLLEKYNIDIERQSKIFRQHPRLYVKSLGSLELKLKYLTQRHKMNLLEEETFPVILNYNYNETIRPRGEILLKNSINVPWKNVLNKTDEEFCQMIKVPLEDLEKIKKERSFNNELDEKNYFFSKHLKLNKINEE